MGGGSETFEGEFRFRSDAEEDFRRSRRNVPEVGLAGRVAFARAWAGVCVPGTPSRDVGPGVRACCSPAGSFACWSPLVAGLVQRLPGALPNTEA